MDYGGSSASCGKAHRLYVSIPLYDLSKLESNKYRLRVFYFTMTRHTLSSES